MDFFSSMRVSGSGLDAQMKRMNTVSSNIANSETTKTEEGGAYKRQDPVFQAVTDRDSFGEILHNELDNAVQGVQVVEIHKDEKPARMVYNPNHPHANGEGFVAMPNVNPVQEMSNMISANRSYEANATAAGAAAQMAMKALELGK